MKKNLLNSMLLVAGSLASVGGAHAESLRVQVPFSFTASGTKLPAGEYSIAELAGNPTVLLIKGIDTSARAMVFARISTATQGSTGLPVVFADEGSDGMALVSIKTANSLFELSSPAPKTVLAKSSLTKNSALSIGGAAGSK